MNTLLKLQIAVASITATGVWSNLILNHPGVFKSKKSP